MTEIQDRFGSKGLTVSRCIGPDSCLVIGDVHLDRQGALFLAAEIAHAFPPCVVDESTPGPILTEERIARIESRLDLIASVLGTQVNFNDAVMSCIDEIAKGLNERLARAGSAWRL